MKSNKVHIPADGIPALRRIAGELSARVGRPLTFGHAYYIVLSAEQAQILSEGHWARQPEEPQMLDKLTLLLQQHPELLEKLLNHDQLNDAENLTKDLRDV
jgi:hypothetical protein